MVSPPRNTARHTDTHTLSGPADERATAVLVVSHADDDHAEPVLRTLARLGVGAYLFDTAGFPQRWQVAMRYRSGADSSFALRTPDNHQLDMARVRSVWWRRPRAFEISPSIRDPGHAAFAYTESVEAMGGFWPALDVFWINEPRHEDAAARKPFQLHMAARAGLHIPRTVVTNDPEEAREFAESNPHGTIYKAFLATERDWRETRMLRQDELALLDRVRHAPVIFQEYIPADADLRVTIVGDRIFPAAIYTRDGAYQYDFRMDMDNARYEPCTLPAGVEHALHRLMDSLGLVYGAVDMRRGPDGRYVFLEVNPSGQWRFVEEKTGQPITEALARALMNP